MCPTPSDYIPTSLCIFYHTYLSVAVVGGVDVVVVDGGACNMVIVYYMCTYDVIKH